MKSFINLLSKIKLAPDEQKILEHFKTSDQNVLSMAKVLLKYHFEKEAIELMSIGVQKYPNLYGLRVLLAEHLFQKGFIREVYNLLKDVPFDTKPSLMATRLLFKASVLLKQKNLCLSLGTSLSKGLNHDSLTAYCFELFQKSGLTAASMYLAKTLNISDQILLPDMKQDASLTIEIKKEIFEPNLKSHYEIKTLSDVFKNQIKDLELSKEDKAKIYEKSRMFHKSLQVYEDLLQLNPKNGFYKKRVFELKEQIKDQNKKDLAINENLAVKLNLASKIEYKTQFLQKLLQKVELAC